MDYLDSLIKLAQIQGKINVRCLFQGDWYVVNEIDISQQTGLFHLIEQGECWLILGAQKFHLTAGDLFFLPRNQVHTMHSQPFFSNVSSDVTTSKQDLFELRQIGQTSPDFKMFCGMFFYQKNALLLEGLPDYLHIHLPNTPVQPLLQLFLNEVNQQAQGTKSVIDALANVLFIYILRYALEMGWTHSGVIGALQDKRLNGALVQMLQAPEKNWQLTQLAALANVSRATFCRLFRQHTGQAPKNFLTRIRLQYASYWLKNSQKSILEIALIVGYQTEAHFSKAFKLAYGQSPRRYRNGG